MSDEESVFLQHVPCDACGSSDANSLYSDGHQFCFACSAHVPGDGSTPRKARRMTTSIEFLPGEPQALAARGISEVTCAKFNYNIGEYRGKKAHIAHYYNADGELVAQHLRTKDKDFPWVGQPKEALPFGANVWQKTGKKIVVTEGEIDAMSMSQVQGNKWPVVSIGCGAGPQIKKYAATHREYFLGFEEVIVMFDNDQPGRDAARVFAEVIGKRAKIAELPLKDANDMLVAGRTEELINAMWKAKPYRPDGIVTIADLAESLAVAPEKGKEWSLPTLTSISYGRRYGEVWVLAAGTGTGKTDLLLQEATHAVFHHKEPVGLFFLETPPREVAVRMAGKLKGKAFHVPDGGWTKEEFEQAITELGADDRIYLYNSFGLCEWDNIRERIRYLNHANDVRYFVIDNLMAFASGAEDERREVERVMSEAAGLAQELNSFIWVVSHLATPEGTPHENGGEIKLRHLRGSRAIAAWAHGALGLERDQQAENEEERRTTKIRVLKDRFSGRSTGKTFPVRYDFATGMLTEVDDMASDHGF